MDTVILPKIEPNMEEASIAAWLKNEGDSVKAGEPLFQIETAKALIEVESEFSGVLRKILVPPGKTVSILTTLAYIGDVDEPLPEITGLSSIHLTPPSHPLSPGQPSTATIPEDGTRTKASPAARRVARELGIDLTLISGSGPDGRIVEENVRAFAAKQPTSQTSPQVTTQITTPIMPSIKQKETLSEPSSSVQHTPRKILIVGAGNGGEVVADILSTDPKNNIIGFVDDNASLWGKELWGRPILGGTNWVEKMMQDGSCTHLCLSITSNMQVRKAIYERLKKQGYSFLNAIHPAAHVNPSVMMGDGNIVGAFAYIGYGSVIGNNNLISAHCDIEHHNRVGSHTLFGPGVMTSGDVQVGDLCSLGAGVNIEPHVRIGDGVAIASGLTIITHIAAHTTVKQQIKSF